MVLQYYHFDLGRIRNPYHLIAYARLDAPIFDLDKNR